MKNLSPEYTTSAELRTLREMCNMSREELAELVQVEPRTIRYWEKPGGRVPSDVSEALRALATKINALAETLRLLAPAALPRFRAEDDLEPWVPGCTPSVWGAAVVRCLMADPTMRVVWFNAADYSDFLTRKGVDHTLSNLSAWARDALSAQAIAAPGDQPPA